MTSTAPRSALPSSSAWLPGVASLGLIAAVAGLAGGPSWGLLIVLGVLGAVVAVLAPGVLFAAYLLLAFYKAALQAYSPIDITVLLAVLTTVQIMPVIAGGSVHVSRAGIALWLALTSLILAGVLYAPDQSLALSSAVTWSVLVFVPLLVGGLRVGSDPTYIRQFLWAFMAMGVLTVSLGVTLLSSTERLAVFGSNTIEAGRAALLVPLIGVAFVLRERGLLVRAVTVALIPAALVVAFATGSRGPVLALLVLCLLGVLRFVSRARSIDWRRAGVAASLAIVSVVIVALVAPALQTSSLQRFTNLGSFIEGGLSGDPTASTDDTSAGARVTLFRLAVSMFEDRPILGYGTAGFRAMSPRILSPSEAAAWPHNALLQFGAEYGAIGVAVFIGLVLLALTRRLPRGSPGEAVRVALLFFLLNAMVSGDIFSDRLTWGLLMLILLIDVPTDAPERLPDGTSPAMLAGAEPTLPAASPLSAET